MKTLLISLFAINHHQSFVQWPLTASLFFPFLFFVYFSQLLEKGEMMPLIIKGYRKYIESEYSADAFTKN